MSSPDFVKLALQLATMLGFALLFGGIMRRFRQPAVVGEMFGATGIILAGVGLANGVIDARIFVAIVLMALITSLMAGPMLRRLLWWHQPQTVAAIRR
jgi:Kef-type K+ transport system membrane component KefB